MNFLNQFPNPTIAKDDNSIFSFTDKGEQKSDLPFSFGTQSSEADEISFLNQMKSQDPGESFALDDTQKNMGGLNFLKTIYEVPESSNNIFNSEGQGFPLPNPMSVPLGLEFVREGNEDNFNFEEFQNKQNSPNGNEESINVDINNLFKHSTPPVGETSKKNSKTNIESLKEDNLLALNQSNNSMKINSNNILNVNIQSSGKKGENVNKNVNSSDNFINININKVASFPKTINNQNNQNKNINITPETRSNPVVSQRQSRQNNASIIQLNKNKFNENINTNIQDNNNILPPQFQNISIKPQVIKEQKNNLDDIDKMISLNNPKPENKPGNKNNSLPSEISDIFSSTPMLGKRQNMEQKDKDLPNIDNLLNFTKEPVQPYNPVINKQKPPLMNNNPIINNSNNITNSQLKKKTNISNKVIIQPLPGDSFDKKSQVIKIPKEEMNKNIQIENNRNKNEVPSKYEIVKRYNDLAVRLNKIREQAKEYRNLGNYFSQLISANENYEFVYPNVIKTFLEEYYKISEVLLKFVKIKNNRMNEMNNEFDEEVRKYSLAFPDHI